MDNLKDLKYAQQSERQKLDVYFPANSTGPRPVILFLHPGGFTRGSKDMVKPYLNLILLRGYVVVSANYRLADEARFPAQIHDAKAAVRWIRTNASLYNFNSEKIAAWGVSAGGIFAALLGTTPDVKKLEDLTMGNPELSSRVSAVVAIITPFDFINMDPQLISLGKKPIHDNESSGESQVIGGLISKYPDRCKAISPMTYISSESSPFYLQHGTADEIVPYLQSSNFAEKLITAIGKEKVDFNLIENANHFDQIHSAPDNINRALDFLDRFWES